MGQVVSLVQTVVDFSNKVIAEKNREKNRTLSKAADRLAKPIAPPSAWPTLKARRANVPSGPYSVEGIRESLDNLIIPVGYSEEQLEASGFGPEVATYRQEVEDERKDLFASFGRALSAVASAVESELNGSDVDQKAALRRAGVNQSTVNRFQNLAKSAREGKLEPQAITFAISEIRTLLEKAELEKMNAAALTDSDAALSAASDSRASGILAIVRRSLGVNAPRPQTGPRPGPAPPVAAAS